MARFGFSVFGAQRVKQIGQPVVVDLLHQGQQATQLSMGETFAGKPVQVLAGQVSNDPAFVFAERHFAGYQQFEFLGVHGSAFSGVKR